MQGLNMTYNSHNSTYFQGTKSRFKNENQSTIMTLYFNVNFRFICTIYSQNKTWKASNQTSHAHIQWKHMQTTVTTS
jgi:hypothetical protein